MSDGPCRVSSLESQEQESEEKQVGSTKNQEKMKKTRYNPFPKPGLFYQKKKKNLGFSFSLMEINEIFFRCPLGAKDHKKAIEPTLYLRLSCRGNNQKTAKDMKS